MRPLDTLESVTDVSFERDVLDADVPVLVDFSAAWCAPCIVMSEVLATLSGVYAERMRIVTVDVDSDPVHAARLGVRGMPSLFLFFKGQVIGQRSGAAPSASVQRWIEDTLAQVAKRE
jgi:thioredoxin 1